MLTIYSYDYQGGGKPDNGNQTELQVDCCRSTLCVHRAQSGGHSGGARNDVYKPKDYAPNTTFKSIWHPHSQYVCPGNQELPVTCGCSPTTHVIAVYCYALLECQATSGVANACFTLQSPQNHLDVHFTLPPCSSGF